MNGVDTNNEVITKRVGRWLIEKEFSLVSCIDKAGCFLEPSHCFGLMCRFPDAKPIKYCFGLIKKDPPKSFLGFLWFENPLLGANRNNWVFEVYDRKNLGLAKQLIQEIVAVFGAKVSLCLA